MSLFNNSNPAATWFWLRKILILEVIMWAVWSFNPECLVGRIFEFQLIAIQFIYMIFVIIIGGAAELQTKMLEMIGTTPADWIKDGAALLILIAMGFSFYGLIRLNIYMFKKIFNL